MISQTLASVLGLFQRMISRKADDFPNFGFGFRVISKDDFQDGG
jgi:hypothetical protein